MCGRMLMVCGSTAPSRDFFVPMCGVPLDEYAWIDSLHMGPAMHDALAAAIVDDCFGEDDYGLGLCIK